MKEAQDSKSSLIKWALTGAAVVGLFVLAWVSDVRFQPDEDIPGGDLTGSVDPKWQTYHSEVLGLQIYYPQEWSVAKDPDIEQAVFFSNSRDGAEQLRIYAVEAASEGVIREALASFPSKSVRVGGKTVVIYENSSNSMTNKVALVTVDGRLYYIGGTASDFEKLLGALQFIEP